MTQKHNCPDCRCNRLQLEWSDRVISPDADSPQEIASAIIACALDHSYDRTDDGIPYGLPEEWYAPISYVVGQHLSLADAVWRERKRTIRISEEEERKFTDDLVTTIQLLIANRIHDSHYPKPSYVCQFCGKKDLETHIEIEITNPMYSILNFIIIACSEECARKKCARDHGGHHVESRATGKQLVPCTLCCLGA